MRLLKLRTLNGCCFLSMNKMESSYLFIPHSPLQFEVFEIWAEVISKETEMQALCLLLTEDLRIRLSDNHPFDQVISIGAFDRNKSNQSYIDGIAKLKGFEDIHATCHFAVDWSIDRAFQNHSLSHEEAVSFTVELIEEVESIILRNNVVGAMSEKLFLPQRLVHHILVKKGFKHVLPIGDRFFSRFYFESGLNEWYWDKILKAYENNRNLALKQVPQEVLDVYDKVIFKKYKKVFSDAKSKSRRHGPTLIKKLQSRLRKPMFANVYSEYLFGDFKRPLVEKLKNKVQRRQNLSDYLSIVTKKVPNSKFILFLFHMQPEYTVDGIAIKYYNQVEFVTNIARSLPADICIVVKENPRTVGGLHRPKSYYKDLVRHPNIIFLHHSVDAHELIKKSMAVVTLTGTVGLEAMMMDKPVIVVGNIFYRFFDRVYSVSSIEEVLETIQKIHEGSYVPFASDEDKVLFGLKVLKSFYDATFVGQMYNGYSPSIHRNPKNVTLLKKGFMLMLADFELLQG